MLRQRVGGCGFVTVTGVQQYSARGKVEGRGHAAPRKLLPLLGGFLSRVRRFRPTGGVETSEQLWSVHCGALATEDPALRRWWLE